MYLEFKDVNFSYGGNKVLKNINLGVEKGVITGLIGANGAGKTTTILTIIKKLIPDSGQIYIAGKNIQNRKGSELKIAYIPDKPVYYEELTVWEHLKFVQSLYPNKSVDLNLITDCLKLKEHLHKIPDMLSKGTLQKLMIALALIREYELLIADEPFSGLDPEQISILKKILLQAKIDNKAILLSTHLLDVAEDICDNFIMINSGKVIALGSKQELAVQFNRKETVSLEEIYLAAITA